MGSAVAVLGVLRCTTRFADAGLGRAEPGSTESFNESRSPSIRLIAIRLPDSGVTRGHGGQIAPDGALGNRAPPRASLTLIWAALNRLTRILQQVARPLALTCPDVATRRQRSRAGTVGRSRLTVRSATVLHHALR